MGMPSAATSGVLVGVTFNDPNNAHYQQNLTVFRMRFLHFCGHASSGGHCSFTAERSRLPRRGRPRGTSGLWNIVERWSSHTLQCENGAGHGSEKFCKALKNAGESFRKETRRIAIRCVVNPSDNPETATQFFFDELMEANLTMQKLAQPNTSADSTQTWQTQEKATSQRLDGADREKSPETEVESGNSNLDLWQGSKTRSGKLLMESNGPPMVILQPYLVSDNSQEEGQEKEKLRQLPFTEPHKMRPPGLPRPSLRRRLGLAYFRKSKPAGQVGEFISRSSYED